jgi:hypothetical protein
VTRLAALLRELFRPEDADDVAARLDVDTSDAWLAFKGLHADDLWERVALAVAEQRGIDRQLLSELAELAPRGFIAIHAAARDLHLDDPLPSEAAVHSAARWFRREYPEVGVPNEGSVAEIEEALARGAMGFEKRLDAPAFRNLRAMVRARSQTARSIDLESARDVAAETSTVSTGFADPAFPEIGWVATIEPHATVVFWVEVGPTLSADAIDASAPPLPGLARGAVIDVVIATAGGEWQCTTPHAQLVIGHRPRVEILLTAPGAGAHTFRCNLYHRGTLLQSRLVRVHVGQRARPNAEVDYALSATFRADVLAALGDTTLSILQNSDDDGTHALRFFGPADPPIVAEATFDADEIQDFVSMVRKALRTVAWGSPEPWRPQFPYRIRDVRTDTELRDDLATLARTGFDIWDVIAGRLAQAPELAGRLRKPGTLQLAPKRGARMLLPLAAIYDHPLDTGLLSLREYTLCPEFVAARAVDAVSLDDVACFRGQCPCYGQPTVVCPGGFWGFRHQIGVPVPTDGEAATDLGETPRLGVAVSLDPQFVLRQEHVATLHAQRVATTFDEMLSLLQEGGYAVIYFYCHGGADAIGRPFLRVGPNGTKPVLRSTLRAYEVRLDAPRSLVFLNGCHTTDLEPERAIDLVSGFVDARASGVIGTEITVFEPLAVAFGKYVLDSLLAKETSIGWAVRNARLALLKQRNPLGLAYIPFAVPALGLRPSA